MGRSLVVGLFAALALAACAPKTAPGPAWPKLHDDGSDGGQSIAPRVAKATPDPSDPAATDQDGDAPAAQSSGDSAAADPGDAGGDTAPAAAAPSTDSTEDTITIDGVTIEVDD